MFRGASRVAMGAHVVWWRATRLVGCPRTRVESSWLPTKRVEAPRIPTASQRGATWRGLLAHTFWVGPRNSRVGWSGRANCGCELCVGVRSKGNKKSPNSVGVRGLRWWVELTPTELHC